MKIKLFNYYIEITPLHLILAVALWYVQFILNQLFQITSKKPPRVFHLVPYVGSAISYGMDPYHFFQSNRKKYGEIFTFVLFGKNVTVALGVEGNDLVLNGKLANVSAEACYNPMTKPVFGEGVVYDVPHQKFMEQKRMVKQAFTTESFQSYVPLIISEYKKFVQTSSRFDHKTSQFKLSITPTIAEMVLFTASRALQGREAREALDEKFAKVLADLDKGFHPINFVFPWIPKSMNRARDKAYQVISQTYLNIIQGRRKLGRNESDEMDMIWNLMDQEYKNGDRLSDEEIANLLIALLMGGQHTSAATLSWTLLELVNCDGLQEKLLEEQKLVLGTNLREPNYEELKKLTLHNFIIKEILRLHPPIHSLLRLVKRPFYTNDEKYIISKGHYVLASPVVTANDENIFPNPLEFIPERWRSYEENYSEEKVDYGFGFISKGALSPYLPFGAGRHRCIGEQFAYVQLVTLLCLFVRDFEIWNPPERQNIPASDYSVCILFYQNY